MTIEYKLDISVWIYSNLAYLTDIIIRFFSILCTLIWRKMKIQTFLSVKSGHGIVLAPQKPFWILNKKSRILILDRFYERSPKFHEIWID